MGHSDDPGDGCGGGRRKCGGNLLVDPAFEEKSQTERDGLLQAVKALRRLVKVQRGTARARD